MGFIGIITLVSGAVAMGLTAQSLGTPHWSYEWVATSIGALIGGYVGGSLLGPASGWGPETDGLFILPALLVGIVCGAIVAFTGRRFTAGEQLA